MASLNTYSIGTVCDVVGVNVHTLKKWLDDGFFSAGTQTGGWRRFSTDDIVAIAVLHALIAGGAGVSLRYASELVAEQRRYFARETWFVFAGANEAGGFSYRGSSAPTSIEKWLNRTGNEDDEEIAPLVGVVIPVHRVRRRIVAALRELEAAK